MMVIFYATYLHLKRMAGKIAVWICLLLPVLLIVGLARFYTPDAASKNQLQAGLVLPATPEAQNYAKLLQSRYEGKLTFIESTTENAIVMVEAGHWECSYQLADDFDERLAQSNYDGIFTKYVSAATTFDLLFDQAVSATLFEAVLPQLTFSILSENNPQLLPQEQELIASLENQSLRSYTMHINETTIHGTPIQAVADSVLFTGVAVARGIIALFLFLLCLVCQVWMSEDIRHGAYARTSPLLQPTALYLPVLLANFVVMLFAGIISLAAIQWVFPNMLGSALSELFNLAVYALFLTALSFLLAVLFYKWQLLYLVPFLLVACLLFSPIVLDISLYFPEVSIISAMLPPTLYLQATSHASNTATTMAILFIVFSTLSIGILYIRKRFYRPIV